MTAFEDYVAEYGLHFNKKLYEFAVSMMVDRNGNKMPPMTKEQVSEWLKTQGVTIKNDKGHDVPYVYQMRKSDSWGGSLATDKQLAMAISEYLDDKDGNPTQAFDCFVVNCRAKGVPIFWDEML